MKSAQVTSYGINIIVIGGETTAGLSTNVYLYSVISKVWSNLSFVDEEAITRRSGCVASSINYVYIYGGVTAAGHSNGFYLLDIRRDKQSTIHPDGETPPALSNLNCYVESSDEGDVFVIFGGSVRGLYSSVVYSYSSLKNRWVSVNSQNILQAYKAAAGINAGGRLVIAGGIGIVQGLDQVVAFDFTKKEYVKIGTLPMPILYSGFVYVGSSIYSFFGAMANGIKLMSESVNSDIYQIDLKENCEVCDFLCSPGTYLVDGVCKLCPEGTYSEYFGATFCDKCPKGTYSSVKGLNWQYQCLPCAEGTFSQSEGATVCKNCGSTSYCHIGSTSPEVKLQQNYASLDTISTQPEIYDEDSESSSVTYSTVLSIFFIGTIILAVLLYRHERGTFDVTKLDIFRESHNYLIGVPMMIIPNRFGAVFSMLFAMGVLSIVSMTVLQHFFENVNETKSLVPYDVLKTETSQFIADIQVEVIAYDYLDSCRLSDIVVAHSNIELQEFEVNSTKKENHCIVVFECFDCTVYTGASMMFQFNEAKSYSSMLRVNVTASSSIPDEVSSVCQHLDAPFGKVYTGSTPSNFYVDTTASVSPRQFFKSKMNEVTQDTSTGYHITASTLPTAGSSYSNFE